MPARRALRGDTVTYRNADGDSMNVILLGGQGNAPGTAPSATNFGTGGTLAAATYTYRYTYVKDGVESPASANSNDTVTTGTTSRCEVTVTAVPGATAYRLYGRTGGSFLQIMEITAPTVLFNDTGSATPSGASPTANFNATFRSPYAGHPLSTGILPGMGANQYEKRI